MTTMTTVKALQEALRSGLREDPRTVLIGEDIGTLGGVFRVTDGLAREFGAHRVIDSPLAESGIVGTAIGLAMRGYRPVCEIQFDGFVYPAFNQIVSQLAKYHARTHGRVRMPVTIRIPCSGGIGSIEHHSESNEAYFCHTAGLRVVSCSSPTTAYRLLRAAMASDDPVIFFEPKHAYWDQEDVDLAEPVDVAALEHARLVRSGTDATVLTYGSCVPVVLEAAAVAEGEGRSLEVIDLAALSPLDVDAMVASVRRTGRAIVVHEAPSNVGLGAEIAALLSHECFYTLEAPVERVGGWNIPYPPARVEREYLPDVDRILDAVDRTFEGS